MSVNRHARRIVGSIALATTLASTLAAGATATPVLTGAARATTVTVTAGKPTELRFKLSRKTAAKGVVVFRVKNVGTLDHDFKIKGRKTRLLETDERAALRVTFTRTGRFQFICTVPGHAAAGMKGTFRIT